MSIEGLNYILEKKELIPTVSAQDLLRRPGQVEADYNRHVRTYIPINHVAQGREGVLTVEDFERKLFNAVKNARSPRGYLTAEYGYGKTSTALYLWKRAQDQNLIIVPPFQLLKLPDLVTATHGWVRHRLSEHGQRFIEQLDALYDRTTNRSLEQEAEREGVSIGTLRKWVDERRFTIDLQADEYIRYFEDVTSIVREAGYDGLILLPDEIQQYIEPLVQSSGDPIVPFFNLLQGLATREGYLNFGFILVTVPKELDIIREGRGRKDLIHRMREISLDLTYVYDDQFARRLWELLSQEFNFKDVAREIVVDETLIALGEIITRNDLSDGPRTVINTFKRMVQRYMTYGTGAEPYTPIDMIDDFVSGAIAFSGDNRIQAVTRRALQSNFVKENPDQAERAVKLAAAFPVNGVPRIIQRKFKVDGAIDELKRLAYGEIIIGAGKPDDGGVTLFGLHLGVQQKGWLPATIREIRTVYSELQDITKDRALSVFTKLLKTQIFKGWKVVDERQSSFVANQSIIFEGDFQSFSPRYPRRRVHVRIIWADDEERKDATIDGDIAIEYYLSICPGLRDDPDARRREAPSVEIWYDEHTAAIPVNLMYFQPEKLSAQIQQALKDVWMPYDLSPLVLMTIYEVLDERRADNLIPRSEDQVIKNAFQPELLDNIMGNLFNADVGAILGGVAKGRITEVVVEQLLDARYRETYRTIMASTTWQSTLNKYASALDRLDNVYQKRGEVEFEGTKTEVAKFINLSNPALDNFRSQYPALLTVTRDWTGNNPGAVRFTLHELEEQILKWLRASDRVERVKVSGTSIDIHAMLVSDIYDDARTLGYQDDEIGVLLDLLVRREMIEYYQKHIIREKPSTAVDLEGVAQQIREFSRAVQTLSEGFSGSQVSTFQKYAEEWQNALERERQSGKPDPQRVHKLGRNIEVRAGELRDFAADKQRTLITQLTALHRGLQPVNSQYINVLNTQVDGGVEYVQHVNVLRMTLLKQGNTVKSNVDHLLAELQRIADAVKQDGLSYESLARYATEVSGFDRQIAIAKEQVDSFEKLYHHFNDWRRLVADGSILLDDLQKMGTVVIQQQEAFDRLVRSIREDISSRNNSGKLDALPNHSIYSSQLDQLQQQVRQIREQAQDAFIHLQNRYFQVFSTQFGFKREEMRPFDYNLSNPEESYRLLFNKVGELAQRLCQRIAQNIREERQKVGNILTTPMLRTLLLEVRQEVETQGNELLAYSEEMLDVLEQAERAANDPTVIRDYPAENAGDFAQLINEINRVVSAWREIKSQVQLLNQQLTDASLTAEEDSALEYLRPESIEDAVDLFDWQNSAGLSHEEFWQVFRSLYEKQRIRILVTRVRR